MGKRTKPVRMQVWPYGNHVAVCFNQTSFEREVSKMTGNKFELPHRRMDGITMQLDCKPEASVMVIGWFDPWRLSTLAHEASHCAFRICGCTGIVLEPDNNEAHAYMLSYIIDRVIGEK